MTAIGKAQVLVIDDSPDVRTLLALWLTGFGCQVRTVEHGEAARRALAHEIPDVILLDVVLPGLNGFEVCLWLKQYGPTSQVPIVMMSGLREPANAHRAREVGAKHFLLKPLDECELISVIGPIVEARAMPAAGNEA